MHFLPGFRNVALPRFSSEENLQHPTTTHCPPLIPPINLVFLSLSHTHTYTHIETLSHFLSLFFRRFDLRIQLLFLFLESLAEG